MTTVPKAVQTPDWQFVIPVPNSIATGGAGEDTEAELDPQQFAEMGLDPSWNCSGGGSGIPLAQIPVLSLTATSTVTQAGPSKATAPATPAEPAPSIPIVSETSKPSATAASGQSAKPVDTSIPYAASTALVNSGTVIVVATDSRHDSVQAPDTALPAAPASVPTFGSSVSYLVSSNAISTTAYPSAYHSLAPEVVENSQSEYIVGSQTLSPGGSDIIVAGQTFSLASFGTELVMESTAIALDSGPALATVTIPLAKITEVPAAPAITFNGATVTRDVSSDYIIGGQTLMPGGPALTISGTVLSLAESGTVLILGSSTVSISPIPSPPIAPIISIDGSVVTADPESAFVIGTQTLAPGGPAITVSGEILSLASSAADLIIISSPTSTAVSSTLGLADIIMSALGGEPSSRADVLETASTAARSATQGAMPFTGSGKQQKSEVRWSCLVLGLVLGLQLLS